MIRIQSKVDGFRRCGIAHSVAPVDYPDGHFTAEQLKALEAESMLTVEVLPEQPAKKGAAISSDPGDAAPPPASPRRLRAKK